METKLMHGTVLGKNVIELIEMRAQTAIRLLAEAIASGKSPADFPVHADYIKYFDLMTPQFAMALIQSHEILRQQANDLEAQLDFTARVRDKLEAAAEKEPTPRPMEKGADQPQKNEWDKQ